MQQYPPQGGYVPAQSAYQQYPPGVQQAPPPAPKKKRGCVIALVILVLLGCCCCCAPSGGLLLLARNAGAPRDLGVTYSEADFDSAVAKAGIEVRNEPADGNWEGTEMVYSGEKPLDATFTQAELSALLSYNHSPKFPLSNVQIRLLGGNQAEASGMVTYQGVDYPVYVKGSADMVGGNQVTGVATEAEVAGYKVPPQYLEMGASYATELVNERLARMPGLNIESYEVNGDQIHVVGTIPAVAERVPAGQ